MSNLKKSDERPELFSASHKLVSQYMAMTKQDKQDAIKNCRRISPRYHR